MGDQVFTSVEMLLKEQMAQEHHLVERVLPQAQTESAMKTMRKAVAKSPTDRGYYRNSWKVNSRISDRMVQLINDAPYAGVLEGGARPFWAPIKPLIEWAERKAGDLALGGKLRLSPTAFSVRKDGNLRYKGRASLDDYDRQEVEAFAYAVQRKIAREGLPPLYIMRKLLPYATRELGRAVRRNLQRLAVERNR